MNTERPFSQALWEHTLVAVQDDSRALEARVLALESAIQRLEATVQQVTEQLRQASRTSSRPPSSEPPQAIGTRPRREPRGRRPGGPPGQEGQTRALLPVEAVEVRIPVTPTRCRRCQQPLPGDDPPPPRHHVTELPPPQPVGTEYQWHRVGCAACGEPSRAELPRESPRGNVARACRRAPPWARERTSGPSAPPHASWGSCWGCRGVWAPWRTWSGRRCRRWRRPWQQPGAMANSHRWRSWTQPAGGQGNTARGC